MSTITTSKESLMRWAARLSVATAIIIILVKAYAWVYTDALSLLSSLVDSVLDVLASTINLLAIGYALKPADEDHRFGHGKAEDIAALAQGTFILGSGVFIAAEAIQRIFNPQIVSHTELGTWAMVICTVLTGLLVSFQLYVVKRTGSNAIHADSVHYQVDLLVNLVVVLSLFLTSISGLYILDALFALAIAAYITKGSLGIARKAFDNLMDKEFEDHDRQTIIEAILEHKDVKGVHDLRTRHSGIKPFIQFHLEMDGDISLQKAHCISDEVEANVLKHFPDAEVLVHQDPEGNEELPLDKGRVIPSKRR